MLAPEVCQHQGKGLQRKTVDFCLRWVGRNPTSSARLQLWRESGGCWPNAAPVNAEEEGGCGESEGRFGPEAFVCWTNWLATGLCFVSSLIFKLPTAQTAQF